METKEIKDFSDLGQSTYFTYNGVKYAIPPLSRAAMTKLLRVNQKISNHVKEKNPVGGAAVTPPEESLTDDSIDEMDTLFGMQQEFVLLGIRKVNEQGQFSEVTSAEIDEWPMRLLHNVIRLINEALTTTTEKEDERPT